MKRITIAITIGLASLIFFNVALGYDPVTHKMLTKKAYQNSLLATDPTVVPNLGLFNNDTFPGSDNAYQSIGSLLELGAVYEDNGLKPIFNGSIVWVNCTVSKL